MYIYITLLSILIHFCKLDILESKSNVEINATRYYDKIFNKINEKPHALYFKINNMNINVKSSSPSLKYSNSSLPVTPFYDNNYYSTPTTMYDIIYEENATTITENGEITEIYTSTEYQNVTEFDVFPRIISTEKPKVNATKKEHRGNCFCNLLYQACDVNCCCDDDCTEAEKQTFYTCIEEDLGRHTDVCNTTQDKFVSIHSLICNAKRNLPDKRNIVTYNKGDNLIETVRNNMYSWHNKEEVQETMFLGKPYIQGSPLWLLNGEVLSIMDLPSPQFNNYCTGRKSIKFLKDETYNCVVKLQDLEVLKIIKIIDKSQIISIPNKNWTFSDMNCSSLLCANWSIIFCDEMSCTNYSKSLHEPICTEHTCKNLALKVEYLFTCHGTNISDAKIILHGQDVDYFKNQLFIQKVHVKFSMKHDNVTDRIVQFSGNPGYINGFPVIVSSCKHNHSQCFLNGTKLFNIRYPDNVKGVCTISNMTYKVITFGYNIRSKCKYHVELSTLKNGTENCRIIQNIIFASIGVKETIFISPFGNPLHVNDNQWIELKYENSSVDMVYGHYNSDNSTLTCNNLATSFSYMFTYANVNNGMHSNNEIFDAKVMFKYLSKLQLKLEDISLVVTYDISFLDITKPPIYKYAGAPQLNIHLPDDIWYPFTYNKSNAVKIYNMLQFSLILYCLK